MNPLKPTIYVVPVVVLLMVAILYRQAVAKSSDVGLFRRFMLLLTVAAFLLNLAWELLQGPLYEGYEYDLRHVSICVLASVADALMVLLLYLGFARILKDALWVSNISASRMVWLIVVGGIGAIIMEMWHLKEGNWAYSEAMPVIPLVQAGLSPVVQFMLLPLVSIFLSFWLLKRGYGKKL